MRPPAARRAAADHPVHVGVIAGQGVEADEWLASITLPVTWKLQIISPEQLPERLDLLLWLWGEFPDLPALQAEKRRLKPLMRGLAQRGNRLAPLMMIRVNQSVETATRALSLDTQWHAFAKAVMRQYYRRTLNRLAPKELSSPIFMEGVTADSATHISEQGTNLVNRVKRWQRRLRRQATWLVQLGAGITVAFMLLLVAAVTARIPPRPPASLISLTPQQWQANIKSCQEFIAAIRDVPLSRLNMQQRRAFADHVRWLLLAVDLFSQRAPTSRSSEIKQGVNECLSALEARLQLELLSSPAPKPAQLQSLEQLSQTLWGTRVFWLAWNQQLLQELLQGAFDPRPGPTVAQQAAQRYWNNERELTIALLRQLALNQSTLADQPSGWLIRIKELLQAQLRQARQAQVHAPPRQIAWQQELEGALSWITALQQMQKPFPEPGTDASLPELLREAFPAVSMKPPA